MALAITNSKFAHLLEQSDQCWALVSTQIFPSLLRIFIYFLLEFSVLFNADLISILGVSSPDPDSDGSGLYYSVQIIGTLGIRNDEDLPDASNKAN